MKGKSLGKKFNKELRLQKQLLKDYVESEDPRLIPKIKMLGISLIIYYCGGKCELCRGTDDLQIHHLISKNNKKFMDGLRYFTQRSYWANMSLLCRKCHAEIEGRLNGVEISQVITKGKIEICMKRYKQ